MQSWATVMRAASTAAAARVRLRQKRMSPMMEGLSMRSVRAEGKVARPGREGGEELFGSCGLCW